MERFDSGNSGASESVADRENKSLDCVHFQQCAGCVFEKTLDDFSLVREAKTFFFNKGLEAVPVYYFGAHDWRTRAKLAVRGSLKNPEIGLFEKNSHQVLSIPQCRVHHPAINKAVESVRRWMVECCVTPYRESDRSGALRYIQCSVERSSGKVQLALVCNKPLPKEAVQKLWDEFPIWQSIWVNENQRTDNVIFGSDWKLLFGSEWLWEKLAGVDCCFHPAGFAQANLTAFEALLKRVGEWISPNKRVVEYYAGAGVIGLSLAAKGCFVSCYEVNAACEPAFNESKKRLESKTISWNCSPTENALQGIEDYDVVVIDPPRKGLDKRTLEVLKGLNKGTQLVYVSCGWSSFVRDCGVLLDSGWKLLKGEIYIFFPGSDHIETLSLFEKIN